MPHWESNRRGAGHVLRLVSVVLAALAVAGAVVIVLLPLPKPAAGGTCGPGKGSETALEAFFNPVSIGAGAEPPAQATTANLDWQAFVGQCQAATNGRMVDALALLLLAGFFLLVVPRAVRAAWPESAKAMPALASAPPGWYPDPTNLAAWRWWDGTLWQDHASAAQASGQASAPSAEAPAPAPSHPGYPGRPEATAVPETPQAVVPETPEAAVSDAPEPHPPAQGP